MKDYVTVKRLREILESYPEETKVSILLVTDGYADYYKLTSLELFANDAMTYDKPNSTLYVGDVK